MSRLTALLLILALVGLLVAADLGSVRSAAAQTPEPEHPAADTPAGAADAATQPAPTANAGGGGPSVMDVLRPVLDQLTENIFVRAVIKFFQNVVAGLKEVVGDVFRSGSFNFVIQTPPAASYSSPTVQALAGAMRGVANAALALVVLWGGFNLIVREHLGAPYHGTMELLPRAVLGALLVNTSGWWTQLAIDANNALCTAIGATPPAFERADPAKQVFLDLVVAAIYLATCLVLVLQQLMRLALVDVLLVLAPLGLVCWVLPETYAWARLWSNAFLATVFTQSVQVLTLKLGASLLTDVTPQAPDAAVVSLLLGMAVLWLTLRIPRLIVLDLESGFGLAGLNRRVPGVVRGAWAAFRAPRPAGHQFRFRGKGWG